VTEEFIKRMDPELPFYYYTSACYQFYQDLMPDFNTKPTKEKRPVHLPKYELLGANDKVTMVICGDTSIRTKFHNLPVDLPPPPGAPNQCTYEHSYCS